MPQPTGCWERTEKKARREKTLRAFFVHLFFTKSGLFAARRPWYNKGNVLQTKEV